MYPTGKKDFENTSAEENFAIFGKAILSILHRFILHETMLINDKDLPWLTNKITNFINEKNTVFKHFR